MNYRNLLPFAGLLPGVDANPLFALAQSLQGAANPEPDPNVITGPAEIQPNGVPLYKVGPGQTFQNTRGSFNTQANYGAPPEDPIEFALKRVANRMANNEGYMDRNAEQFNALSTAAAQKQQADFMRGLPAMQEAERQQKLQADQAERQQKLQADSFDKGSKLRSEFLSKITPAQQLQEISPIFQSLAKSKDDPQGSDLDFVYGIAKILDPGSVVRQGEQDMLVRTGGLPGLVHSALEFVQGGQERLAPEMKEALLNLAARRYDAINTDYEKARGNYGELAKAANVRPEDLGLLQFDPSSKILGRQIGADLQAGGQGGGAPAAFPAQQGGEPGALDGARQAARLLIGQGLGLTLGDEAEASLRSGSIGGLTPDLWGNYDEIHGGIRKDLKDAREYAPKSAAALEIIGGIPSGGALLKGLGAVKALATPARQGAALGALVGFGSGEGGLKDRATSAAIGGAVGGGTALAADAAAKGIGKLASSETAQKLQERFGMLLDRLDDQTGAVPSRPLSGTEGITRRPSRGPSGAGPKLQNLTPEEAALYELTINEPSERLLEGAGRYAERGAAPLTPIEALDSEGALLAAKDVRNSRGGSAIFDALVKERGDARPRLKGLAATVSPVDDATRAGQNVQGAIRGKVKMLDRGRDAAGEALYGAAHAEQPLIQSGGIEELLKSPDVGDVIKSLKNRFPGQYGDLPDTDSRLLRKALSSLRGKVGEAVTSGNKELGRDLAILADQLDEAINSGGEGYALAREGYKRVMRPIESLIGSDRMGTTGLASRILDVDPLQAHKVSQEVFSMQPGQLENLIAATGEEGRQAMKGAARGYLEQMVDKATTESGFEPLRNALRKGPVRENLELILGPKETGDLVREIEKEILIDTGNKTFRSITRSGSPTTPLAQQAGARQNAVTKVLSLIKKATTGDLSGLTSEGVDALTKSGITKNDEMARRIANIMTGGAPEGMTSEGYNVLERLGMHRAAREPYVESIRQKVLATEPASREAGQAAARKATKKKHRRY